MCVSLGYALKSRISSKELEAEAAKRSATSFDSFIETLAAIGLDPPAPAVMGEGKRQPASIQHHGAAQLWVLKEPNTANF